MTGDLTATEQLDAPPHQQNLMSQPKAHGLPRVCATDCLCRLAFVVLVDRVNPTWPQADRATWSGLSESETPMLHHHLLAAPEQHLQAAGFILRGIRGVLAIIGSVIAGVICAFVAKSKGYSAVLFGILGLIFSVITLIVVLVIPRKR